MTPEEDRKQMLGFDGIELSCGDVVLDARGEFSHGMESYYLLISRDRKESGEGRCFRAVCLRGVSSDGNVMGGAHVEEVWDEDLKKCELVGRLNLKKLKL